MPTRLAQPCKHPRCAALAAPGGRWCVAHAPAERAEIAATRARLDSHRGSAASRGYGARWAKVTSAMRARYPLSSGYLARTALWTANLARQLHTLREAAAMLAQYDTFFFPAGAGARFLADFPIYTFHPSPRPEPAEVTDHILPHRGDATLMWAEWNLQTLSKRQHDTKTAREDGGFRGAHSHPSPMTDHPSPITGGVP
jgi:5-methylcytosine-specific restriction enzyme A